MADTKKIAVERRGKSPSAILVELEHVLVNGREIAYKVMKDVLKKKDLELAPGKFSHYFLNGTVRFSFPAFFKTLGKTRLSEENLRGEIEEHLTAALRAKSVAGSGVEKILLSLAEQGVGIGLLSSLDRETATAVLARTKLQEKGVTLLCVPSDERPFPLPDAWLKLAKNMSIPYGMCTALASSSTAGKAALSAGMRCAAIPDTFTSAQDFGGADCVVDTVDSAAVAAICALALRNARE